MWFDPKVWDTYGMHPYNPEIAQEMKTRHRWLSEHQGVMFAAVPVHTRDERDIFALLMETSKAFSNQGQPDWTCLANEWSTHCDGKTVFYKVCWATPQPLTPLLMHALLLQAPTASSVLLQSLE